MTTQDEKNGVEAIKAVFKDDKRTYLKRLKYPRHDGAVVEHLPALKHSAQPCWHRHTPCQRAILCPIDRAPPTG